MSTKDKNIPDFLDRVYCGRKEGTVIAFDETEICIHYDDDTEEWIRFERVRLKCRAADWAYIDGELIPSAKGLIGQ